MNNTELLKLEEAHNRAKNYVESFLNGRLTIEQFRYRMVQLVRQSTIDAFTLNDGILLVNQLLDEYISDPVMYRYNIWDASLQELSIISLFNPNGMIEPGEEKEAPKKESVSQQKQRYLDEKEGTMTGPRSH